MTIIKHIKPVETLCVDFDGTMVKYAYPKLGEPVPFALEALRFFSEHGVKIILYTMRSHKLVDDIDTLQDALDFFNTHDIPLYGVNENPLQNSWSSSRKIHANAYVDDNAVGCPLIYPDEGRPYVDWKKVFFSLTGETLN